MWLTGRVGTIEKSLIIKCNETTAALGERKGKREEGWGWDFDAPVREHWIRINQSKTSKNWNKHWFSFPLSNSLRMVSPKSQEVSMQ